MQKMWIECSVCGMVNPISDREKVLKKYMGVRACTEYCERCSEMTLHKLRREVE